MAELAMIEWTEKPTINKKGNKNHKQLILFVTENDCSENLEKF